MIILAVDTSGPACGVAILETIRSSTKPPP